MSEKLKKRHLSYYYIYIRWRCFLAILNLLIQNIAISFKSEIISIFPPGNPFEERFYALTPKLLQSAASPPAKPLPIALNFHSPLFLYISPTTTAVSTEKSSPRS